MFVGDDYSPAEQRFLFSLASKRGRRTLADDHARNPRRIRLERPCDWQHISDTVPTWPMIPLFLISCNNKSFCFLPAKERSKFLPESVEGISTDKLMRITIVNGDVFSFLAFERTSDRR